MHALNFDPSGTQRTQRPKPEFREIEWHKGLRDLCVSALCALCLTALSSTLRRSALALDDFVTANNLTHMKTKPNDSAVGRSRAVISPRRHTNGAKAKRWSGFAPELGGVMTGPSSLSVREGFAPGQPC